MPIRDPKNMQSDPRKIHMPTLRLSSPVLPMFGSWARGDGVVSHVGSPLVRVPGVRAVVAPSRTVHGEQGQEAAHDDLDMLTSRPEIMT